MDDEYPDYLSVFRLQDTVLFRGAGENEDVYKGFRSWVGLAVCSAPAKFALVLFPVLEAFNPGAGVDGYQGSRSLSDYGGS